MAFLLNFKDEGFTNKIIINEQNLVKVKTNAFNADEAWKWKGIFTKKNSVSFNAGRL